MVLIYVGDNTVEISDDILKLSPCFNEKVNLPFECVEIFNKWFDSLKAVGIKDYNLDFAKIVFNTDLFKNLNLKLVVQLLNFALEYKIKLLSDTLAHVIASKRITMFSNETGIFITNNELVEKDGVCCFDTVELTNDIVNIIKYFTNIQNTSSKSYIKCIDYVDYINNLQKENIYDDTEENYDNKLIVVARNITKIPKYSFNTCLDLETVYLPNTILSIDDYAFFKCPKLKNISLPNSVTKIGISSFGECDSLEEIKMPDKLTTIPVGTFADCPKLHSVDLNNISNIEKFAFRNCISLSQINLSKLTNLGENTFAKCSKLENVTLPFIRELPNNLFSNCVNIKDIEIPFSVSKIGNSCFYGCGLKHVVLPETLIKVDDVAFKNCVDLETIEGENVLNLGNYALASCDNLQTVNLKSLTKIGEGCFKDDYNLKDYVIPETVESIGKYAFENTILLYNIEEQKELNEKYGNRLF